MKSFLADRQSELWTQRGPLGFNWGLLLNVFSGISLVIGLTMMTAFLCSLVYQDGAYLSFLPSGIFLTLVGGFVFLQSKPPNTGMVIRPRDISLIVTLIWLAAGLYGTIPFLISGTLDSFAKALFESMSGFTTTGTSSFEKLHNVPESLLFWRSLTQWVGGIGIIVAFVGLAPYLGPFANKILQAENPGPATERLTPKIIDTAKILLKIYILLTILGAFAFYFAGMNIFDAVNHSMTTLPTAGFSTRSGSIGGYNSLPIEIVAICLMVLGGVNFAFYYRLATRKKINRLQWLETLIYLGVLAVMSLVIVVAILLAHDVSGPFEALRAGVFSVVSMVTTTGLITEDFYLWNDFSRVLLLLLMFVGGCTGSTTGGLRILRWLILFGLLRAQIQKSHHPGLVSVLKIGGKTFTPTMTSLVMTFVTMYFFTMTFFALLLMAMGTEAITSFAASASALSLSGIAMGEVGSVAIAGHLSDPALLVCSFLMLLGRLEIFAVLALLAPRFWKDK